MLSWWPTLPGRSHRYVLTLLFCLHSADRFHRSRSVKRTTNVPIGDSNKRGQFSSPPRSIRRPELDEVGLSIWGSLDMTSILRWPCPYEVTYWIEYSTATLTTGAMRGLVLKMAEDLLRVCSLWISMKSVGITKRLLLVTEQPRGCLFCCGGCPCPLLFLKFSVLKGFRQPAYL